jgi:hypothetical protein
MNLDILRENKYISAILASQKVGYSGDYIGQLCRLGKIPGELRGRTWYVDLNSLINHKQNRQLGRRRKITPSIHNREFTISYQTDGRPLLPTLDKSYLNEFSRRQMSFFKRIVVLGFSTAIVVSLGGFFEHRDSIFTAQQTFLASAAEALLNPLDSIIEEYTGARGAEYAAFFFESAKEFGGISQSYLQNILTNLKAF